MTIDQIIQELKTDAQAWAEFVLDNYGELAVRVNADYRTALSDMQVIYEAKHGVQLWRLSATDTEKYLTIMKTLQDDARQFIISKYIDSGEKK